MTDTDPPPFDLRCAFCNLAPQHGEGNPFMIAETAAICLRCSREAVDALTAQVESIRRRDEGWKP